MHESHLAFPSVKIHVVVPNLAESLPDHEENNLKCIWHKGSILKGSPQTWSLNELFYVQIAPKSIWLTLTQTNGFITFWYIKTDISMDSLHQAW